MEGKKTITYSLICFINIYNLSQCDIKAGQWK